MFGIINVCQMRDLSSSARPRTSSHHLEIERGRYNNVNREDRVCKLCGNGIEHEVHFLLICPSLQH